MPSTAAPNDSKAQRQAERLGRQLLEKINGPAQACSRLAAGCDPASWGAALKLCLNKPQTLRAILSPRDATDALSQSEVERCCFRALSDGNKEAFAALAGSLNHAPHQSATLARVVEISRPEEAYFGAIAPSLSVSALNSGLLLLCQRSSSRRYYIEWAAALMSAGASPRPNRGAPLRSACAAQAWDLADFLAPFCDLRDVKAALCLAPAGSLPAAAALVERQDLAERIPARAPASSAARL